MSAAKMVADSTQGDLEMSSAKKRKKTIQKKKTKKKKESNKKSKKRSLDEEFEDSDLDLDKAVHPLSYFVKDRESLLDEMFHCIRGHSLNRALPDILKELPLGELKRRCMEQLEVMSKKRIRRILAGDDPATISSSGTEEETSEEEMPDMEEGEVEQESIEGQDSVEGQESVGQCVDSTSLCSTPNTDSDREVLYEDSVGQDSPSPTEDALETGESSSDQNDQYVISDEDVILEDNDADHSEMKPPQTPEELEEGEVIEYDGVTLEELVEEKTLSQTAGESEAIEKTDSDEHDEGVDIKDDSLGAEIETAVEMRDDEPKASIQAENFTNFVKTVENNPANDVSSKAEGTSVKDNLLLAVGSEPNVACVDEQKDHSDTRIVKPRSEMKESCIKQLEEEGLHQVDDAVTVDDDSMTDEVADAETDCELTDNGKEDRAGSEDLKSGETVVAQTTQQNVKAVVKASGSDTKPAKQGKDSTATEVVVDVKKAPRRIVRPPKQDIAPALTKNQMELLELEMRARAIKAMLKTAK